MRDGERVASSARGCQSMTRTGGPGAGSSLSVVRRVTRTWAPATSCALEHERCVYCKCKCHRSCVCLRITVITMTTQNATGWLRAALSVEPTRSLSCVSQFFGSGRGTFQTSRPAAIQESFSSVFQLLVAHLISESLLASAHFSRDRGSLLAPPPPLPFIFTGA